MKLKIHLFTLLGFFTLSGNGQWTHIDSITYGNINSINFMNADTGFVYNNPGIIWRTANGGQSWDSIPLNYTGYINDMAFANKSVGYAVGGAWFPHGVHYPYSIFKTTDGGLRWDSIHTNGDGGVFDYVATLNANEFFTTSQDGMLHSDDGGLTYDTVSVTNQPFFGVEQYGRVRFLNASEGYVLARSNSFVGHLYNLYKTTNGGQSWQSIHADSVLNFSLDFVMTPYGNGIIVGNDSFVLRTANGGATWDTVPLASNLFLYKVEEVAGHLYAIGNDVSDTTSCIFHSSDWGSSWQKQFSKKASTGHIVDMSITSSGVGYFTDWRNVYKNSKLISLPEAFVGGFELYPNPANNTVSLELANASPTKVFIHNSLGQRVKAFSCDGESIVSFDVSMLKAGLYILTVHQGGVSITRKFLKE